MRINNINKSLKIIFLFTIILINFLFNQIIKYKNNINIKICVCSPGKQENKYIVEFIEHYKNYGVDKIYLYDNNNVDGEHFEEVINNYIKKGFVDIINFRGKKRALYQMMNDCYRNNYMKYDWLIFFELDEYIHLKNYNLKEYLNNKNFSNCNAINLNWFLHTDNDKIYYENKTLKERFPITENRIKKLKSIKTILKGHIPNITISNVHFINKQLKSCDGYGNPSNIIGIGTFNVDFNDYYIDHYSFKSTEEFVNKMNKGDVLYNKDNIYERIKVYFDVNKITKEKIDYFDKKLPFFNESKLRKDLLNKIYIKI